MLLRRKVICLCVLPILLGCKDAASSKRQEEVVSSAAEAVGEPEIAVPQVWSDKGFDYGKAHKYQTFDEYRSAGVGKVRKRPFVYVMNDKDTVLVKRTDMDYVAKYVKKDGYIHNRMAFRLDRIAAPIYTITYSSKQVYIKHNSTCVTISATGDNDIVINDVENPFIDIKRIVALYNSNAYNPKEYRISELTFEEDKGHYYYVYNVRSTPPPYPDNSRVLDSLVYDKTSLVKYGIEPGLSETGRGDGW